MFPNPTENVKLFACPHQRSESDGLLELLLTTVHPLRYMKANAPELADTAHEVMMHKDHLK